MRKVLSLSKKTIPLGIGIFFIYLTYINTTAEDRENIIKYIQNANYRFVFLSVFFGILSHISRAVRWQYLLVPLGYHPKTMNSILAVLIGYLSNLGIPRSGELLRASVMDRYESIPFQKGFGTIIAERVVDLVILFTFLLVALGLQYDLIADYLNLKDLNFFYALLSLILLFMVLIVLRKFFRYSTHPITVTIKQFFQGLWEGMVSIKHMKNKVLFVAHTIFIWLRTSIISKDIL